LFGVGFVEQWSLLGQAVDVELDPTLVVIVKAEIPVPDLGL